MTNQAIGVSIVSDTYYDLGEYRRQVTTSAPEAQLWFDRGLLWAYCFNFDESARCFERAASLDPHCAMAHWGAAFAKGPNYNKAWRLFDSTDLEASITYANAALERARASSDRCTPFEQALIEALTARFPTDGLPEGPEGFGKLDVAYAEAMRAVYRAHPEDLDAAALFADALMCVSPRALWDLDSGEPVGYGTVEAREVIEQALARPGGDRHPVLNHLYIHLMEMSPYPEIALPAADRLRNLAPDGSHLAHMATHIDAACGDWRRVVDSNTAAAAADDKYFAQENPQGWIWLYRAHNLCVLAYGAMMSGRSRDALRAARRLDEILTPELLQVTSPPMADLAESYRTTLPHVLIRFGRWEEILELEPPQDQELFCSTTAMIHYARGIAYSALGRIAEAEAARDAFAAARAAVPESRLNSLPAREVDVLAVAAGMLDGELEYRKGNFDDAFAALRRAIELEDALPYTDPPAWLQPVRHAYGALLMEQGRTEEAVAVYRADLYLDRALARRRTRPNNVWSLHGLHECLTRLGRHDEAEQIALARDIAVATADIPVAASCFCRLSAFTGDAPGCCGAEGAEDAAEES
ncbi:tetratricopeptide repeat protein [Streptomyces violens]|uniref:tetratricopeptide repeat protein n=1 Tax=Streptomyces violens TaxID=66377 RepID=UPI00068ED5B2|nr:tetratricopeptide repeat protein [Streptomyces violens]